MADVSKEIKKKRSRAKATFTTKLNNLESAVDDENAVAILVNPAYDQVMEAWDSLNAAQDEFLDATEVEEIETDPLCIPYLDESAEKYRVVMRKYAAFLKTSAAVEKEHLQEEADRARKLEDEAEKLREEARRNAETELRKQEAKEKFESAKKELEACITSFANVTVNAKDSLEAADSSGSEIRKEWVKIDAEFMSMKEKLLRVNGMAGDEDTADINTKFTNTAETAYTVTRAWIFAQSKDEESSASSGSSAAGDESGSSPHFSSVKKEPVQLPSFKGDEAKSSPFLMYPPWKKQWDTLIGDHPEKYRASFLITHLDDAAKKKFVGWESNYPEMMKRLDKYYGNPQKIISCVMKEVNSQPVIQAGDYRGLVMYTSTLEENYNRLRDIDLIHEMSNTSTLREIIMKFPRDVGEDWYRHLSQQSSSVQLRPLDELIVWLDSLKDTWERMSSIEVPGIKKSRTHFVNGMSSTPDGACFGCGELGHKKFECPKRNRNSQKSATKNRRTPKVKKYWCAFHKDDPTKKCWSNTCTDLQTMPDAAKRIQLLKDNGDCEHCCGDHKSDECRQKGRMCGGGKQDRGCTKSHPLHELFCATAKCFAVSSVHSVTGDDEDEEGVLLQIMVVRGPSKGIYATVMWDLGSSSNFVRIEFAERCGFRGSEVTLSVTTLSGAVTDFLKVTKYNCSFRDENGMMVHCKAYGLESITGALSTIDADVIREMFPGLTDEIIESVKRGTLSVDFLIGSQHPSWHPKMKERAEGGGDMWLYQCRFGVCLGGRHPLVKEETRKSDSLFHVNHVYHSTSIVQENHALEFCEERVKEYLDTCDAKVPETSGREDDIQQPSENHKSESLTASPIVASTVCHVCKSAIIPSEERFLQSESMGTVVEPRCGGCRCSKCPVPGSQYSFREQKEFDNIQKNLSYNKEEGCWYTELPWKVDRSTLPKNDKIAMQSLLSLEKNLMKNPELAEDFCTQIQAMVDRGAAIVLTDEEVKSWEGAYYFLPVLGVKGKKKWLRVVFDASRRQGGYPSMNDCLEKGPDRFINNLLSVVLGFRNGRVGAAMDIKKFHNRVRLFPEDIHMQRFLWRNLQTDSPPKTYAVTVNNFGVKPANCIATSALHKSADEFSDVYPSACKDVKDQTYVDDGLVADVNMEETKMKTKQIDEILDHASMPNKGWTFSGDKSVSSVPIGTDESDVSEDRVLGLAWDSESDTFHYSVELDLKIKNEKGEFCEIKATSIEHLSPLGDTVITRRLMLRNTAKIFDPSGWWCPVLLEAKILMRESWADKSVGWDDPLPRDLAQRWWTLMKSLLKLKNVRFDRSLWPQEEVKGLPMLIIFSDGSVKAFGAVAYIRWELLEGGFWTQLIMAKSKIAPKNIVSIPRMELNGAVLGNRIRNFITDKTNLEFSRSLSFVDSSTALGYVHKESGVFGPYEGIRVAEIHTSNNFVDERLEGWAWAAGENNPADYCTKPRTVDDVDENSFWQKGPDFLRSDESSWPIMHDFRTDKLEGEKSVKSAVCSHVQRQQSHLHLRIWDIIKRLVDRVSLWRKMCRVMAWLLRIGSPAGPLDCEEVKRARYLLIKFAQEEIATELEEAAQSGTGRFRKLAPVLGEDGIWRVGSRLQNIVPFTIDAKLPKILPYHHTITSLIMRDCHNFCHAGQDGTLSRFRAQGYWVVKGGNLAKKTKSECVPCRKIERILLSQPLGGFPVDRLSEPVAWGYCQLDLFGPFSCRGDVNPRTSKKTWGIVIEDSNSGAVHLDIVQDYSAHAVMMSLRRFGSLRGWPGVICSDPGSQLESASGKLDTWWTSMGTSLRTLGSEKNFRWEISPPDSPWRQGKAERRIAIVKKLLKLAVGDSRVTPVELQTILMEVANICNERPIGLSKPRADGSYVLITPNQLLLGRSSSVLPDDTKLAEEMPVASRYRLVNHVTTSFWKMWSSNVSPGLVVRQKWHTKSRNLREGDVVMICGESKIKAKYKLGVVHAVKESSDGIVRSVTVRYSNIRKNSQGVDIVTHVHVKRSVQRLALILPVEESSSPVLVKDLEHSVECTTETSGGVV